jgi:hypothetical protein
MWESEFLKVVLKKLVVRVFALLGFYKTKIGKKGRTFQDNL